MSVFKVIIIMKYASFFGRKKPQCVTYIFRISYELSTWSACPTTSVGTCWRATLMGRCMCGGTGETRSPTSSNTDTTYVHDCAIVCWCWPKTGTLTDILTVIRNDNALLFALYSSLFACLLLLICSSVVVLLWVLFCFLFFCLFVCLLFNVTLQNFSLICRRYNCCWREHNLGLWSALTALDQGGIFIMP